MHREHSSNSFLLELLFAIFFFIIIATICLQIFAKSHFLNQKTKDMNRALELIQNEVEYFYSGSSFSSNAYKYFDVSWNVCEASEASYKLINQYSDDDSFNYLTSSVISLDNNDEIYSLTVKIFKTEGGFTK